jgi:hypothetical protein
MGGGLIWPCRPLHFALSKAFKGFLQYVKVLGSKHTFTMVTMGGDLQPGSLADRLLTGLGQPQINP